jgi:sulfate adenylyltransferase subunit 2
MQTTDLLGLDADLVWTTGKAFAHLHTLETAFTKRTAERRLQSLGLLPEPLDENHLVDEAGRRPNPLLLSWALAKWRKKRKRVFFCQLKDLPTGQPCLHANDARQTRFWIPLSGKIDASVLMAQLSRLQQEIDAPIAVLPTGELAGWLRGESSTEAVELALGAFLPVIKDDAPRTVSVSNDLHLKHLEDQSIYMIREALAESNAAVLVYTGSKSSSVLLHLTRKAFFPALPPVRLLLPSIRHECPELSALKEHVFTAMNGSGENNGASITMTAAEAETDLAKVDIVLCADRPELFSSDSSLAAVFASNETPLHRARYEIGDLLNIRASEKRGLNAIPLSQWTDIELWQYIDQENITILPLYFTESRLVVQREGKYLLVNDAAFSLQPGEEIIEKRVRMVSLNEYAGQGVVASNATTVPEIVLELSAAGAKPTRRAAMTNTQRTSAAE